MNLNHLKTGQLSSNSAVKELLSGLDVSVDESMTTKGVCADPDNYAFTQEQEDAHTGTDNTQETMDKKKKLISGRCTKPDEAHIKQVLKFPHEKLDPRHIGAGDRVFDKLTFPLLVAGELEIASCEEVSDQERRARINIAKTICYHKAYLNDQDLRDGYNQLIKSIEQGKREWDPDLGERLHEFYDYQANKLVRERVQHEKQASKKNATEHHPQVG